MWWILFNDFIWRGRFTTIQAILIATITGLVIGFGLVAIAYFLL